MIKYLWKLGGGIMGISVRERADELFGTKNVEEFCERDPFHPQNEVRGFISRRSTELYGAILITHVNGQECIQLIFGTPKMGYPFDRAGRWHFPSAKKIEVYEKLDGTNILAFTYKDNNGKMFLTYKTRLRPFVVNSRFGEFLSMWQRMLERYPHIQQLNRCNGWHNISYELYGAENKHLIQYDVPLEVAVLFAIDNGGNIFAPSNLVLLDVPHVSLVADITRDYVWNYSTMQQELESKLQKLEDGYRGFEGTVWYLTDIQNRTWQFKCKPETIEQIHWAASGLSWNTIYATCVNALENFDIITFENVSLLLQEEFSEAQIAAQRECIEKIIQEVMEDAIFKEKVLAEYRSIGLNIHTHKAEVMRHLASVFPRNLMKRVYAIIINNAS